MEEFLDNPVYHALRSGDARLANGNDDVKYFDREVSPYVGIRDGYSNGFGDLFHLFQPGREILIATRKNIEVPEGWELIRFIEGSQFVLRGKNPFRTSAAIKPVRLAPKHSSEMVKLAALTRPGPFDMRTIEFGNYFGIFEGDRLVAMTGERLHVYNFTEVSAVCTHPGFLGKGYASILLDHQVNLILAAGQIPFLHVKADNHRAIFLYERVGFVKNGAMNFYFMEN
jgi:ribosomal protein S18 acetylase RimI-like enzyme